MHAIGFEVQRVRVQRDAPNRRRPVELLAQLLFGEMANQRRRGEETQQSEHDDEDQHADADAPGPTRACNAAEGMEGRGYGFLSALAMLECLGNTSKAAPVSGGRARYPESIGRGGDGASLGCGRHARASDSGGACPFIPDDGGRQPGVGRLRLRRVQAQREREIGARRRQPVGPRAPPGVADTTTSIEPSRLRRSRSRSPSERRAAPTSGSAPLVAYGVSVQKPRTGGTAPGAKCSM
jgi:hypothetical protein